MSTPTEEHDVETAHDEFESTGLVERDLDDRGEEPDLEDLELDGAAYVATVDFGRRPLVDVSDLRELDDEDDDAQEEPSPARPHFANAAQWVEQWLIPHYKRNPRTNLWDQRWWEYTEVVAVFEALWQAWEFLRVDSMLGPAVFFRDYLWPAMREITGPEGPFFQVKDAHGRALPEPWPTAPVPEGLYRPAGHPDEQ